MREYKELVYMVLLALLIIEQATSKMDTQLLCISQQMAFNYFETRQRKYGLSL